MPRFLRPWLALVALLGAAPGLHAAEEVAVAVDLTPQLGKWGLPPREQGARPTCSVFAFTGVLEFAVAKARGQGERLSVEYVNWAANRARHEVRDGGFFSEMWQGFARHGVCGEAAMPYLPAFRADAAPAAAAREEAAARRDLPLHEHWIKEWDVKRGLSDGEFQALKEVLQRGWPVCGGFRWPKREAWKDGVLQLRQPDQVFDGHSVLLTGYRDDATQAGGGVLLIRDSATGKDLSMPYAYARDYMNDALWIEATPAEAEKKAAE